MNQGLGLDYIRVIFLTTRHVCTQSTAGDIIYLLILSYTKKRNEETFRKPVLISSRGVIYFAINWVARMRTIISVLHNNSWQLSLLDWIMKLMVMHWIHYNIVCHQWNEGWVLCLFVQSVVKLGLYSLKRHSVTWIGIPIINLRRSDDQLRFIMGIVIKIK